MKTFEDVLSEIKSSSTKTKSGKTKKTHSKADFNRVILGLINEPDYTTTVISTKNGEKVETEITPVKDVRNSLKKVLTDFGVDKQEAETILTDYKFTKMDGMYEFISEAITNYLDADKKFDFLPKEDFVGSIVMNNVPASTKEYPAMAGIGNSEPVKVSVKAHRTLGKKSKAPEWAKKKLKLQKTK